MTCFDTSELHWNWMASGKEVNKPQVTFYHTNITTIIIYDCQRYIGNTVILLWFCFANKA